MRNGTKQRPPSGKKHSTKMRGGIFTGDRGRLRRSSFISQGHVMAKAPKCKRQHEEPIQPSLFGVVRSCSCFSLHGEIEL